MTLAKPEPGYDDRCRKVLAFVVGLEGSEDKRLPSGVFQLMMDMLMVRWDPLREGPAGGGSSKRKMNVHWRGGSGGGGGGGGLE